MFLYKLLPLKIVFHFFIVFGFYFVIDLMTEKEELHKITLLIYIAQVRNNPAALLALCWYWATDGVGSKVWVILIAECDYI